MRHIRLCEEFENKTLYTPSDIEAKINELKPAISELSPESTDVPDNNAAGEAILMYIKKLEGYRIRLRELHWSTQKHSEHVLTDSLMSILTSHEDEVAEVTMGLLGIRIKVGQVVPELPQETDLRQLLNNILNAAVDLKMQLEDKQGKPIYAGLVASLDDCIQEISKGKYLETLS